MSRVFKRICAVVVTLVGGLNASFAAEGPTIVVEASSTGPSWAIQLPGASYHFEQPTARNRKWNQFHPGLGLERNEPMSVEDWHVTYSAGVMKDSVAQWGANAGVVWQKTLYQQGGSRLDVGPGVFAFYRAVNFDGPRKFFVAPLPVATYRHLPSGLGLNVVAVPPLKSTGGAGRLPGLVYFQLVRAL